MRTECAKKCERMLEQDAPEVLKIVKEYAPKIWKAIALKESLEKEALKKLVKEIGYEDLVGECFYNADTIGPSSEKHLRDELLRAMADCWISYEELIMEAKRNSISSK